MIYQTVISHAFAITMFRPCILLQYLVQLGFMATLLHFCILWFQD